MNLLQQAQAQGLIAFDSEDKKITYLHQNKTYRFTDPEEQVRAETYCSLVLNYGYEPQYIDFEVSVQQGGGDKYADIVIYSKTDSKKAFLVIECKQAQTSDKPDNIRKQARSYARAEELRADYFAYIIGGQEPKIWRVKNGYDEETHKLPYAYTSSVVYAYIDDNKSIPDTQSHFQALSSITSHELKAKFSRCHDILWAGNRQEKKALQEFNKLLFLKMYDELQREEHHLQQYIVQTYQTETDEELLARITEAFNTARKDRKVEELLEPLNIRPNELADIITELQSVSLINTDNDPKGLAFETFSRAYMKGEHGQFFTPRNIVEFMLSVSPITWDENFTKHSTVLDPCTGSGSFLVHAISRFKERYKKKENWQYFANTSVLGSELNEEIAVVAKINIALHDDGHDNIKQTSGFEIIQSFPQAGSIDLILTNPPFGINIANVDIARIKAGSSGATRVQRTSAYKNFELAYKTTDYLEALLNNKDSSDKLNDNVKSELLFFELYHKMLKEGGIAEVVVPDGVLINSSQQAFRGWLSEHFRLLAVISLPQFTFSHYEAGVKSSIVIVQKLPKKTTLTFKAAQQKHLKAALNLFRNELDALEQKKADLAEEYAPIAELRQRCNGEITAAQHRIADTQTFLNEQKSILKATERDIKTIKTTDEFKAWYKDCSDDLNNQIATLHETIREKADETFRSIEPQFDYPIFMAIAENIGYDATGRETAENDLPAIAVQLTDFLRSVKEKRDHFFA
jgi:type I restriction enzyme M protein